MTQLARSVLLSVLLSFLGTYLLRRVVLASMPDETARREAGPGSVNVSVVVVPVVVGNIWAVGVPGALRLLGRRRKGWKKLGRGWRRQRMLKVSR